jgi:Fe2+ transport system protein FeoA
MAPEERAPLSTLNPGDAAVVVDVQGKGAFRRRLLDMGFTRGVHVKVVKHAPLRNPTEYCIGGTHVTLREREARQVIVDRIQACPPCGPRRSRWHAKDGLRHKRIWRRRRSR